MTEIALWSYNGVVFEFKKEIPVKGKGAEMNCRRLQGSMHRAAKTAAVAVIAVLLLPAVQAKNKSEESTQIFTHPYDEVFQAVPDTIERMGMFVTDKNPQSGQISGKGVYKAITPAGPRNFNVTFSIHVETVSAKPETRVTMDASMKGLASRGWSKVFMQDFYRELQKVLATYK